MDDFLFLADLEVCVETLKHCIPCHERESVNGAIGSVATEKANVELLQYFRQLKGSKVKRDFCSADLVCLSHSVEVKLILTRFAGD